MRAALQMAILLALFSVSCGCGRDQLRREETLKHVLLQMRAAVENFYEDKQRYPENLSELVPNYIRKIPPDPITRSSETWIEVRSPSGEVEDVRSGAAQESCDGTSYGRW